MAALMHNNEVAKRVSTVVAFEEVSPVEPSLEAKLLTH